MAGEEEIGTLVVVVLKAQNLHNKSFFKQDVYATVTLNGVTKKTKVDVKGGQHPMWDDELRFPVLKDAAKKHRELEVSCWAKEHKDDTLLGEAKVDMTPTVKSGEFDEWVPLSTGDAQRGDIYLEITYYSNAPVPKASLLAAPANLARRPSKLSPAERLHRPTHSALNNAAPKLGPGHAKTGSVPVPTTLKPGPTAAPGGPSPTRVSPIRVSPKQQEKPLPSPVVASPAVPSILQPGNPQANPHPPVRRTSSSPPQQAHATPAAYPTTYGNTPNPYLSSTPVPTFAHNGAIPHAHDSTPNPYLSSTPAQTFNHNGARNGAIPHAHDNNTPNPYMTSTPAPTFTHNGTIPHAHDSNTPNPYMSSTPAPTFTPNAAIPHTHDNNAANPYISSTPASTFTHNGPIPQTHGRSGSIPYASTYSPNTPEVPPPAQDWNTPFPFPFPTFLPFQLFHSHTAAASIPHRIRVHLPLSTNEHRHMPRHPKRRGR
ncbi:hypothetical protein BDP27DRAFT_361129 [Rhodocollybia butyracea]|uniref:C2 domain-containing protein n=1 Tax=Rhodocollybia butyracea TaxID=206335 RepID=A0A9P5U0J8_9AGAR|nr:hypothetical protein BDP27DRAFT_361129 [Rhodocollybia butyracea]